ncbi:hypothetical protein [Kordiimonas aquimaris]|uniref:hypothetical protein n=1 Tax=Kordiimonas aquimaris TaxID=707591 RepID=UPI0021D1D6BE|nr:hypothetical protein [Kordiimonas aquimaris]
MYRLLAMAIKTISVIWLIFTSTAILSQQNDDELPVYGAKDLKLDTSKLRPHRLLYDPKDGIGGYKDGLFADGIYINPQVSITLDRTVYYNSQNDVQDAIRVRWVANTHPHTDELIVDAKTLSTINEQVRTGKNWETKNKLLYVRDNTANISLVSDKQDPSFTSFPLEHSDHYGLMILPYLFASMDIPIGSHFKLPAIGSSEESFIEIQTLGPASFIDAENKEQAANLFKSVHSWGYIEWYIDPDNSPYHKHAVWHFGADGTPNSTAVSKVIDSVNFKSDIYENILDKEALKQDGSN